jgi:two-component system sensor histidine kinase/response regulator
VEEPIDDSAEPPGEGPVSSRRTRQLAGHYGVAVVAVGLALLLQWLLFPLFGVEANASPYMMFFAAVMVAAWFGALGPGLLATGCSALLSW